MDKATMAAWASGMAALSLDDAVRGDSQFMRRPGSLAYSRSIAGGKQQIHMDLLLHPRYAPDQIHLVLRTSISFPAVAKVISSMLGVQGQRSTRGGVVHVAVLDQIAPNPEMILFRTEAELDGFGPKIKRYVTEYLLPYLSARDTVHKFALCTWESWSANSWKSDTAGKWPITVAACWLAIGDRNTAQATLDTAYPLGSRERARYSEAFAVVSDSEQS